LPGDAEPLLPAVTLDNTRMVISQFGQLEKAGQNFIRLRVAL
jgi:hypothetical protein